MLRLQRMENSVYHKLAKHLDRLPGGFPSTPDGLELRILKRLFMEPEARLACHLTLIPETAQVVAYRCGWVRDTAATMLAAMWQKGLILKHEPKGKLPRYMACQFVVGTSARNRSIPWPLLDPRQCAERIDPLSETEQIAVLFGREDRGLTNDELKVCNLHLNIPTSAAYSSLNLAMAVQIICYELHMLVAAPALPTAEDAVWDTPFSNRENMERFYTHLEQTLTDIEFLDPAAPRQLMPRMRRLYGRVRLDEMELNILRGILTETQKWVKKGSK